MLNLDNPKTQLIFQASVFTDELIRSSNQYISQNWKDRKSTFTKIKTICKKLVEFCKENNFKDINKIQELSTQIINKVTIYEEVDDTSETESGHCKVCKNKLLQIKPNEYYCKHCSDSIIKIVEQIEYITGIIYI